MPLEADHSSLPTSAPQEAGNPPDRNPRFGHLVAAAWAQTHAATEDLPFATPDSRLRGSWAGQCSRRIGYEMTNTEPTNPLTIADHWRFGLGHAVHAWLQEAVLNQWPDAEAEYIATLIDGQLSLHGDIFVVVDGKRIAIELKSINGFGFKKAIGARGAAEGPRGNALTQGCLGAYAKDADELVIIYLALELLSAREAKKFGGRPVDRFVAEWSYDRATIEAIAHDEIERMSEILADVDADLLPPRRIPDLPAEALVVNPMTGQWTIQGAGLVLDSGSTWHCGYCPFQVRCTNDAEKGQ